MVCFTKWDNKWKNNVRLRKWVPAQEKIRVTAWWQSIVPEWLLNSTFESYQVRLEQDKGIVFPREQGTNLIDELMCLSISRGDLYFVVELVKLMVDNTEKKEKRKQSSYEPQEKQETIQEK